MAENIDNEKKNTEENKDAKQESSAEKTVSSSGQTDKTQELTPVDNTAKSQEKAESAEPASAEAKSEEHTEKGEEKTEASAASEAKTENTAEMKTAGKTVSSAPKTEAPKPAKPAKKKVNHKKVWTIIGICALCFGCGFGGGVVANYTGLGSRKNDTSAEREEMEKFFEQLPSQFDNNGSQGSNGSGSSGSDGTDGSSSASPSQGTQNGNGSDSTNPFASKAALGITVQQVTASDDQEGGVYVVAIADESNAADAGVKVGDRIVKVDNTEVTSVSTLAEYIASKDVGDKVTLTLKRDDQEITAEVTLISKNSVSSSDNEKA